MRPGPHLGMLETARNVVGESGVRGLYRGIDTTVTRAAILGGTKMGCYDTTKQWLRQAGWSAELTRAPRGLRWVRTGYAYQPPALGTYRTHRAACPQGPAYCTYWVRVPASGVP